MNHTLNDPKYREQPIFCENCKQNTIGIVTIKEGIVSVECKNCLHTFSYSTLIVDPRHSQERTVRPTNTTNRFTQVRKKPIRYRDDIVVEDDGDDDDRNIDIAEALDSFPVYRCYLSCRHEYISPDARIYTASLSTTLSKQSDIDYFKDIADHGNPMVLIPAELFEILTGGKASKEDD